MIGPGRIEYFHAAIKSGSMFTFYTLCFIYDQGEALFQTHENLEHLAMMERVLGPIPQHMVLRAE
jgi:hypothetical protein